jgi:hypothetical protein
MNPQLKMKPQAMPPTAEPLEPRQMLAGVTVLIHGFGGNISGWVRSAADAIARRTDGSASEYVMTVSKNSRSKLYVSSFQLESGPKLSDNTSGEAIVKLDWSAVGSGKYSTVQVGAVVASYLMQRHGSMRALVELPIHLIGHSRGASMVSAISRSLGARGIWVDQNTYLDPHPVDGVNDMAGVNFGDQPMLVYDNVLFADNYWRSDGDVNNLDSDGESVPGAYDLDLNNIVQTNYSGSAHMAVTAYYHGTIDLSADTNGDHPVIGAWYGDSPQMPARDQTGFAFSRIGNLKRPAEGVASNLGGTASRVAAGQRGKQWGNLANMRVLGGSTLARGTRATLRFVRQDRDGGDTLTVFLDEDCNPYNGTTVKTLHHMSMDKASSATAARISIPTDGLSAGTYYLGAQIADGNGHLRFAYAGPLVLSAAAPAKARRLKASAFSTTLIAPPAAASALSVNRVWDLVATEVH